MQRTIRLKLAPLPQRGDVLNDTLEQSTACFNRVAAYGWEHQEKNGVKLHRATYYPLRLEHPRLPAQLVCAARVKATEAVRSALALVKQGRKVSCPTSARVPIRYDARTYRLLTKEQVVSLSTTYGRQPIPFKGNPHAGGLLGQATGFDSADLISKKSGFWLHVVVTLPDVPFHPPSPVYGGVGGGAVGVDLGLNRPMVTSSNKFFGSRHWREIDRRYFRLRRKLQAKGTRSARRHLRKLAGKVNRFRRDCDHLLSRCVVDSTTAGTTIVVENLVNIRSRTRQRGRESRRRLHSWSFAQLRSFLEYKAEQTGCMVSGVDPRHTSQACSRCEYIHRSNRRSQSLFRCRSCGFQLNAARKFAGKHLAGVGIPDPGGLPVNQPIVSHTSPSLPLLERRGTGRGGCRRKPPALAGGC